MNKVFEYHN